ncbi:MAG: PadR family transcriptional regulator [Methanomicrobia archaeon]|nr:PadR family transcriptional regulator [Methanomicrobia archaeon]
MENLEAILFCNNGSELGHVLHLYASNINKYSAQIPFIASANNGEKVIYVTAGEDWVKEELEMENLKVDVVIYRPEEMGKIRLHKKCRIIIDVSSFGGISDIEEKRRVIGKETLYSRYTDYKQREEYLSSICKNNPGAYNILCSYNIDKLEPRMSDTLMKYHDKVILTTDGSDVDMPSSILLQTANNIAEKYMVRFVKNYLDMIVLALVLKKKMCGTDIIKSIQKCFNVPLSTGTVYPLLHDLEEKGLLDCEYGIRRRYKKKIYKPNDEEQVKNILIEHLQSNNILNKFLQSFPSDFIVEGRGVKSEKRRD